MDSVNNQSIDFWEKFQNIKYDIDKASLEDVNDILNHYDQGSIMVNGINYHYNINPLYAACLNERYKQLTGRDHPVFISKQEKVLDRIIESEKSMSVDDKPSVYQRLKNNLTGEGLGIGVVLNEKDSYIKKFNNIKYDISKARLEDVKDILDHYDQDSILVNGIEYYFRPNALQGASLNARYKELTGQDHPTFLKAQKQILEEEIRKGQDLSVNGRPSIYQSLSDNTMQIGGHDHILNNASNIMMNPQEASFEDVSSLLDYYNGPPVLIDGVAVFPFNDPICASKLNARYREFTGENHPVYVKEVVNAINELMKSKKKLIKSGAFDSAYFDKLEQIKDVVQQVKLETTHDNATDGRNR